MVFLETGTGTGTGDRATCKRSLADGKAQFTTNVMYQSLTCLSIKFCEKELCPFKSREDTAGGGKEGSRHWARGRSGIDAPGGFGKIGGRGGHDVRQEFLRIAVVEREPRALNLNFDAMSLEKGVVGGMEAVAIFEDGI
jgi:hypothetical protein